MENLTLTRKDMLNDAGLVENLLPLGDKRDVANMLGVSVRSVDNYLAEGCPHMKPTPRCVRFDLNDVREWFKTKYGQQCRKPIKI